MHTHITHTSLHNIGNIMHCVTDRWFMGGGGGIRNESYRTPLGDNAVYTSATVHVCYWYFYQVVMREGQTLREGEEIASDLMKKLGISDQDLVTGAYMDLILKSSWLILAPGWLYYYCSCSCLLHAPVDVVWQSEILKVVIMWSGNLKSSTWLIKFYHTIGCTPCMLGLHAWADLGRLNFHVHVYCGW